MFSLASNFKKLTFARLFFLNFSNKSPWSSLVSLKFESYNLQHCKKNCRKLAFWVFTEQLLYYIIFWRPHCYELKCNKSLTKKVKKKKDFRPKNIYKKLVQSKREKQFGRLENKPDNV